MNDLISRQAAIDELKKISFSHWFECGEYLSEDTREIKIISSNKALETIEDLPSVQPDIIACGDCKHYIPHDKRCGYWNHGVKPLMWCSQAERRTDERMDI